MKVTVQKAKVEEDGMGRKKLSLKSILEDLENGLDKEMIGQRYGLTNAEVNRLFRETPQLKGRRPKKKTFILVNDLDEPASDSENNEAMNQSVESTDEASKEA